MKKVLVLLLLAILFVSCSKKSYKAEMEGLLNKWAYSIKELNYKVYKETVNVPKPIEQFKEMYAGYYLDNITIVKIKESDNPGKLIIDFDAEIIKRKGVSSYNILKINSEIRKSPDDGKWKISNRTIIKSDI